MEHHQSHYWEMQFLFDGIPAVLHGTKVGIGTVLMLELYNRLAEMERPDFAAIRENISGRPSVEDLEQEMRRCYRDGAEGIIELEKKSGKNDPAGLRKRLTAIEEKWDQIQALAGTAPKLKWVLRRYPLTLAFHGNMSMTVSAMAKSCATVIRSCS